MRRRSTLALTLMLLPASGLAQTEWFPPEFEDGAARQLVRRLSEVGVESPASEEEQVDGARRLVRDLVTRIDGWGAEGIMDRAPGLGEIDLPEFRDPTVRAIALYGICSLPLHPELVATTQEKVTVAMGEIGISVVSAYLRHQFLAAGGTDEQLEEWLNTDEMNQLSYDVQAIEEQRDYVVEECGPLYTALFGN